METYAISPGHTVDVERAPAGGYRLTCRDCPPGGATGWRSTRRGARETAQTHARATANAAGQDS